MIVALWAVVGLIVAGLLISIYATSARNTFGRQHAVVEQSWQELSERLRLRHEARERLSATQHPRQDAIPPEDERALAHGRQYLLVREELRACDESVAIALRTYNELAAYYNRRFDAFPSRYFAGDRRKAQQFRPGPSLQAGTVPPASNPS